MQQCKRALNGDASDEDVPQSHQKVQTVGFQSAPRQKDDDNADDSEHDQENRYGHGGPEHPTGQGPQAGAGQLRKGGTELGFDQRRHGRPA